MARQKEEYEDGVPGVTLTLAWRIVYRYVDPEGVERALPVYRWYSLNLPDAEWSDRESSWNTASNVVTTNDTCAWAKEGALTADYQPSQINLEEWPILTAETGTYKSFAQYIKENPTPTPEEIADEVAACA